MSGQEARSAATPSRRWRDFSFGVSLLSVPWSVLFFAWLLGIHYAVLFLAGIYVLGLLLTAALIVVKWEDE